MQDMLFEDQETVLDMLVGRADTAHGGYVHLKKGEWAMQLETLEKVGYIRDVVRYNDGGGKLFVTDKGMHYRESKRTAELAEKAVAAERSRDRWRNAAIALAVAVVAGVIVEVVRIIVSLVQ